ncbi:MAG: SDR family NAD(P)-dependent oxidoreductase [Pseudomonadota bacterium]
MKRVLITGGSDGIGRALVDTYLSGGWDVFATGRRARGEIEPALQNEVTYIQADLTESTDILIGQLPDRLDLAILNAGLGKVASVAEHQPTDIATMVAVNTTAPLLLAHALYHKLQGGTLAFIGSTAARGAHADFGPYAATKAAIAGAARSLALEWEGKVKVLAIHPGPTSTGMHDKAGLPDTPARRFFTPAATVAKSIASSIDRGKSSRFGMGYTLRHALAGSR